MVKNKIDDILRLVFSQSLIYPQMKPNYYQILGLNQNATEHEIKSAYRKKANQYHPDKHVNKTPEEQRAAQEQFVMIQEAYDTLSDPEKSIYTILLNLVIPILIMIVCFKMLVKKDKKKQIL